MSGSSRTYLAASFALALLLGLASLARAAEGDCEAGRWYSPATGAALCNGGFGSERWIPIVRQRLGVSAETARRVGHLLERCHDDGSRQDSLPEADARQIEAGLVDLLAQEPSNLALAEEIAWAYNECGQTIPQPSDALLDLVRRAPDPAAIALRFDMAGAVRQLAVLEAALAARPDDARLWRTAGDRAGLPNWRMAFYEEAWRVLSEKGTPDEATGAARAWIVTLIGEGLAEHALAAFQELPEPVRARLLTMPPARPEPENADSRNDVPPQESDLRMPLAMAWALTGDAGDIDRAAAITAGVKAARIKPDDQEFEPGLRESQRRLVSRWTHPAAPATNDPFDLFVDLLESDDQKPVFFLLLGRLAAREGYPAFAAHYLGQDVYRLRSSDEERFEPAPTLPERVQHASEAYGAELRALAQTVEDEAKTVRAEQSTVAGPDPAAATIARLLKEPARPHFAEHPLPAGFHPVERLADLSQERRSTIPAPPKLPQGFAAVRIEQDERRVAAIGLSQDYDPLGEVSAGGYWVLLSEDGGKTWGHRIYTGLRMNQPYVVRQLSALPLWDGDRLRVEVEVRDLDTETITFPPIGLTPKRVESGLYLEIPLEDLRRDTDRDGLTDLAEERLLTDANDPDTDRDGLRDGADPLPTVARAGNATPAARALAVFLGETLGFEKSALIEGVAGSYESSDDEGAQAPRGSLWGSSEQTSFFVADRGLFAALSPARRVIVLSSEERDQARKRFGPFFPREIELFALDRAGHRAIVLWNSGWQGETILLQEKRGVWTAKQIGGWIS
jgi:hypothetical protein